MTTLVRVLELVGESKKSFGDAIENAVAVAVKHVPNITGVEVYNLTGDVQDGQIVDYKANVKVAYAAYKN